MLSARTLFALSLVIYLATRLIGLEDWPIYFFSDEAVHANRAEQLLRGNFRIGGDLLPTYFQNGPFWNIGTSVYLQVFPLGLFGKTVAVTRGVSVIATLVGAAALALMMRPLLAPRYWWTAVLLLSTAPTWFLHSRTAFETVEMASLYALALLFYKRYLGGRRWLLYPSMISAGAAFYAYSPGQIVVLLTAFGLLVSDWRFHIQRWRVLVGALFLAVLLAVPLVRFQYSNPGAMAAQLHERGSLLVRPVPITDKIAHTASEYLLALSPNYWFVPNNRDIARHIMPGFGNLWLFTLPLVLVGIVVCVRNARSAPHRMLLVALICAPVGAALADTGVTRAMPVVIVAMALAAIGLDRAARTLERWYSSAPLAIFLALALLNVWMLRAALVDGPTWHRDYGLYGMQYGGRQLLGELVPDVLRSDPSIRLGISPSWANGTDQLFDFFLTPTQRARVSVTTIDNYLEARRPIAPDDRLVMIPDEYSRASASPFLKLVQVERTLDYPDGRPGFYFGRIEYADDFDAQLQARREQLRQPVTAPATYRGETMTVMHSRLGAGEAKHLFDGDRLTLVRGLEANPLRVDASLPAPRQIAQVTVTTGSMADFSVRVIAFDAEHEVQRAESRFRGLADEPTVAVELPGAPFNVSRIVVEVQDHQRTESAQIHIREIEF